MASPKKFFKAEYAATLVRLAEEDLKVAGLLCGTAARPETALFHVQQAVEKALKAMLCHEGKALPMAPNIDRILIEFDTAPPHADVLDDLTPFATILRYEEGRTVITAEDV